MIHDRIDDIGSDGVSTRLISVVDAVCCVYFCAAGKASLLVRIFAELGMEVLIPAEVEREVLNRRRCGFVYSLRRGCAAHMRT